MRFESLSPVVSPKRAKKSCWNSTRYERENLTFIESMRNTHLIGDIMSTEAGVHKKGTFSLLRMIEDLKMKPDFCNAGAIALFIGVVRGVNQNGERVKKLELEAYEERANSVFKGICADLKKKGAVDVQIHHLLGEFNVGEDLVYVLVAADHRRKVFPILEEAVERYKKEAPIFKKEQVQTEGGKVKSYWVTEETAHK